MTRFGHLHLEEMSLHGENAYTVDGTPADCVNIGIYHLYGDEKPDLIVSGINAGINAGLGFIWSSGTLGACFEGNIAGIPGIAFSQHFDSDTRSSYIASYAIADETFKRLQVQTDKLLGKFFDVVLAKESKLLSQPITWNVNFPFLAALDCKFVPCPAGQSFYGSCYSRINPPGEPGMQAPETFEHDLEDIYLDPSHFSDQAQLSRGQATVTPIDIRTFAQLDEDSLKGLQTAFGQQPPIS